MNNRIKIILMGWLVITACSRYSKDTEEALSLAGDNRGELERVLEHYREQKNRLGIQAAQYLISGMAEHFAYDTADLHIYRPILHQSKLFKRFPLEEKNRIKGEWNEMLKSYPMKKHIFDRRISDVHVITSEYLIEHIDAAIQTWVHSPFRDSISKADFFEYILPYRKKEGSVIENWQSVFTDRHPDFPSSYRHLPVKSLVDSIMKQYRFFVLSNLMLDYPFLTLNDLMLAEGSSCHERAWFNTLLFSSLGIPVTYDFIPAWANRFTNHAWNTVRWGNTFYAFEQFWQNDGRQWRLKSIYNNIAEDVRGKFKIPKVFRYSYQPQKEGPLYDDRVNIEDIPPFFRNPHQKDVSHEYFKVRDVHIEVEPISDAPYCYLCVYNDNLWKPVQWGVHANGKAVFKGMGCNIVYLPAFFEHGFLMTAGSPFILQEDGHIRLLTASQSEETIHCRQLRENRIWDQQLGEPLMGARIQVANRSDFSDAVNLVEISKPIALSDTFYIDHPDQYRFIRFLYRHQEPDESELETYHLVPLYGRLTEMIIHSDNRVLRGNVICSENIDRNNARRAFDNNWYSSVRQLWFTDNSDQEVWVGLDFGQPEHISKIEVVDFNDNVYVYRRKVHELFYWGDHQWNSLGTKRSEDGTLTFDSVPKNALLWLRFGDSGLKERIFTYENEQQVWW